MTCLARPEAVIHDRRLGVDMIFPTFGGHLQKGILALDEVYMERKDYKRYSREFKLEAVRLASLGEKPKAQIARDLGIRVNQLRKWRLDFELEDRTGAQTPPSIPGEEIRGLRRENVRLRDEIELLKKAAMYFARGSR